MVPDGLRAAVAVHIDRTLNGTQENVWQQLNIV
jgi:hypothetical protein